jgi:phosphoribosylformylglycinamidine synthase
LAGKFNVKATIIGKVTEGDVVVNSENWGSISSWKNDYDTAIEKKLA